MPEVITRAEIESLLNGDTVTHHITVTSHINQEETEHTGVDVPIVLAPDARVWLLAQRPTAIWRSD